MKLNKDEWERVFINKTYGKDYMENEWWWDFVPYKWIIPSGTTRIFFDGKQIEMYCNAYTKYHTLELVSVWRKKEKFLSRDFKKIKPIWIGDFLNGPRN